MCGDLTPGNVHGDYQHHVREECQRQPFEIANVALIRKEYLQQQARHPEHHHIHAGGATDQQAQCFAHRRDVGGDVDRIGADEQGDDRVQHRTREMTPDVGGQAVAGDTSNPGAH